MLCYIPSNVEDKYQQHFLWMVKFNLYLSNEDIAHATDADKLCYQDKALGVLLYDLDQNAIEKIFHDYKSFKLTYKRYIPL